MKACFADTFYFLALLSSRDQYHEKAVQLTRTLDCRIITTAWVLTELANGMCQVPWRQQFSLFFDRFHNELRTTIVPASEELFEAGLRLYLERQDKDWSLTDCISFVVMNREGLTEALTGDAHFQQAGYVTLFG